MIITRLRRLLRRGLLGVSRSRPGARMVAGVARSAPRLIPRRVALGDELVIFRHPVPVSDVHLVAIPRGPVADAHSTGRLADGFWLGLEQWLAGSAGRFGVAAGVTNLGSRQDVRLLHVHLLGEVPDWLDSTAGRRGRTLLEAIDRVRTAAADEPFGSWATYAFAVSADQEWKVGRVDG